MNSRHTIAFYNLENLFDPEDGGNVYGKDKADVIKPDFVAKNYDDLLKEFDL